MVRRVGFSGSGPFTDFHRWLCHRIFSAKVLLDNLLNPLLQDTGNTYIIDVIVVQKLAKVCVVCVERESYFFCMPKCSGRLINDLACVRQQLISNLKLSSFLLTRPILGDFRVSNAEQILIGARCRTRRNCMLTFCSASEFGFNCFNIGDLDPRPTPETMLPRVLAIRASPSPR